MNILYDYYDEDAVYNTSTNFDLSGGVLIAMILIMLLGLLYVISLWKTFKKAGQPGWASIIPIYNLIIMVKIANLKLCQVILSIIPIVNIYIYVKFSKSFGKSTGFGILLALFPYIFMPILAFSKCEYISLLSDDSKPNSILDVQSEGVPNNSDQTEFSYGYEKQPTVVMDPVDPNTQFQNDMIDEEEINDKAYDLFSNMNEPISSMSEPVQEPIPSMSEPMQEPIPSMSEPMQEPIPSMSEPMQEQISDVKNNSTQDLQSQQDDFEELTINTSNIQ